MTCEEKIDSASPYFLGSGDPPGNLITHITLKGDNYVAWVRAITISLKARRKFVFVDRTINKLTETRKLLNWETVNSMIVSWILRSIDPKLAGFIPYHVDAKSLWDYLEEHFCVANGPRLQQLCGDIVSCFQTKGMTMDAYYTRLMGLYDELTRLKPLCSCLCGACTCHIGAKLVADKEEEMMHQFLIGIDNDLYGVVGSNL